MKEYNLKDYGDLLSTKGLLNHVDYLALEVKRVTGLTFNSKEVEPGTLFVCKGANFKEEYLHEAVNRGAIGYLSEKAYDSVEGIASFIVSDIRLSMPYVADLFFNSPGKQLTLIAVGGTKGKTTTTHYVKAVLDEYLKDQGKKDCGLISSIRVYDGLTTKAASNTTPEAIILQRYLANAVEAGLEYMAIEVSSQALKYNRVDGLTFDVGIFLNISNDHISPQEHADFNDYFMSKMKMFEQTKTAVVNQDTDVIGDVLPYTNQAEQVFTYSMKDVSADFYASSVESTMQGTQFKLRHNTDEMDVELAMPGTFNVENALATIAAVSALDVPFAFAKKGLKNVRVPGRMETWTSKDGQLSVIVDYAHNKLSFAQLFPYLRKNYPDTHIIAVYGAVGGKAYNRRKELGDIVGQYADEVIFTMIHPDMEAPSNISASLAESISEYDIPYRIIHRRGEAIRQAIQSVDKKTLIVVTGRGAESTQRIKGKDVKTPTDIDYVKKYLEEYENNHPVK